MAQWIEQIDTTKQVRWGVYQPEDIKDNFYLVKKGEAFIGKIRTLVMRELEQDDGEKVEKPDITMLLGEIVDNKFIPDDTEIRFICHARMQTDLGLNPSWTKDKIAQLDDILKITYTGKEGRAHTFNIQFWK